MCKYILVVDDDICLAYAIQSYLSSPKRKIYIVDNPINAIKLLKLYAFDLVISDVMMSKYDGYDLLSYLRLNQTLSFIPFIFLTAKGMTTDRIKGYNLGCNAYLTKPFHPSELLSIVNNLLNSIEINYYPLRKYSGLEKMVNKSNFTSRELSVLKLLVRGMMNKEIASILRLSTRNIEKYVSRLLSKTRTRNRTELSRFALTNLSELLRANDGTRTRE